MYGNSGRSRDVARRASEKLVQQPVGMENKKNVCYLNSTLQIAGATDLLVAEVQTHLPQDCNNCKARDFCLTEELNQHFNQIAAKPKQIHNTLSFQDNLTTISRSFKLGEQQDAMECYSAVVNTLCEQNPLLNRVFKGKYQSRVICDAYGHNSDHLEDFTAILLDVHNFKGKCDIVTCLRKFVQPDVIEEYMCTHCDRIVPAKKTMIVKEAPPILALHLSRCDPFGRNTKNNKFVSYPERLDLAEFITSSTSRPVKPKVYRLYSVMIHKGAYSNSGHYFAFVKMGGQWYRTDDTTVRQVNANMVMKQNGAYVLFYQAEKEEKTSQFEDSRISDEMSWNSKISDTKLCEENFSENVAVKELCEVDIVNKADIVNEVATCEFDVEIDEPCVTKVTEVDNAKHEVTVLKSENVISQVSVDKPCESDVKTGVQYSACESSGIVAANMPCKNLSYPKCMPRVTFTSLTPKPLTVYHQPVQTRIHGYYKPIENRHFYSQMNHVTLNKVGVSSLGQGYKVDLKTPSNSYNQSAQSVTTNTSLMSQVHTSFTARKPAMTHVAVPNPQKRRFVEIDDTQSFCVKRQHVNAQKAYPPPPPPPQMVFVQQRQGTKRKANLVEDCVYPVIVKVARVNNNRWI